MKYCWKWR